MSGNLRIGTSGWVYKHWKGVYYPEDLAQKDWFGFYARDFDTVEINNTFYRLPPAETFENWGKVAPPGFIFTFKASRFITHVKRLNDPAQALENFLSRARGAGQSLGPILYQLPPGFKIDTSRLKAFLQALPADLTHVFEFRHPSWYADEVRELLGRHRICFAIHDHGHAPGCPEWVTGQAVYLRFHGSAEAPYSGSYGDGQLGAAAEKIVRWLEAGLHVFVYFNNDIGGHAVRNALTLKALVENPS